MAILTQLEVIIYDADIQSVTGVIKKLGYPRSMIVIPNKDLLLVQYSDNLSYLYSWQNCERIYSIIGLSSTTKKIKCSQNGTQILYADNLNIQMWDINKACISMFLNSVKNVNCYAIDEKGDEAYCGTYAGSVIVIKCTTSPNTTLKVPHVYYLQTFDQSVMGIEYLQKGLLIIVTMDCQVALISSNERGIAVLEKFSVGSAMKTMNLVEIVRWK